MAKTTKVVVIENTTTHVIVLKAMKQKPLRLFPGFNHVDQNLDYEAFFKGSKAAQANIDEGLLRPVDAETLTDDQHELAKAAREKNETMNKAYKILEENKRTINSQSDELLAQAKTITDLEEKMVLQAEQLADVLKKLDEVASNKMTQDDEAVDEE